MGKKYVNSIAQLLQKKDESGVYLKITEDGAKFKEFLANVKPGDVIWMNKKQDDLDRQLQEGRIDEDRHAELSEKLSFIKLDGTFTYEG